ncbi:MAG: hypothetical protein J0G32_03210 [Alphaproteobacteria bacterium]|nr:hypothetical protein [Alphaproteobacteria bacterium]OJV12089.1 MAG: hypothetical protein BGO27_05045 [Alphaproteobacteria bacterium 33-17]
MKHIEYIQISLSDGFVDTAIKYFERHKDEILKNAKVINLFQDVLFTYNNPDFASSIFSGFTRGWKKAALQKSIEKAIIFEDFNKFKFLFDLPYSGDKYEIFVGSSDWLEYNNFRKACQLAKPDIAEFLYKQFSKDLTLNFQFVFPNIMYYALGDALEENLIDNANFLAECVNFNVFKLTKSRNFGHDFYLMYTICSKGHIEAFDWIYTRLNEQERHELLQFDDYKCLKLAYRNQKYELLHHILQLDYFKESPDSKAYIDKKIEEGFKDKIEPRPIEFREEVKQVDKSWCVLL